MNTDFDKVYLTNKEHFLLFKTFKKLKMGIRSKNMMELYTYQIPITDTVFIPGGIVFTDISRLLQLHF